MQTKQRHPRIPIMVRVSYGYKGAYLFGYTKDMSRGGIFIQTDNVINVGTRMLLQFSLPGHSQIIKAEGRVIWVVPSYNDKKERGERTQIPGMGIEFLKMGVEDQSLIRRFVQDRVDSEEEVKQKASLL
jgi:uncharacterized protein (TIGR02266 family)